jgi:2-hydroxy-3-keto-5-methylthiopentenyl-1-phosphate phosphatase
MIALKDNKKLLIQCDFDGTVTVDDISFMLLDAFAAGDWRTLDDAYTAGKITVGEFNEKAFAMLRADKNEMLDYLKGKVVVRAGFKDFAALCKKKGIRLVIVSNGWDFYVKQILGDIGVKDVEYHSAETYFEAGKLKVRYVGPEGQVVDTEFKEKYVSKFVKEGYHVVYIGNGTSDLSPARGAQQIFATDSLLENCRKAGINCVPFSSFDEINQVVSKWS